jgi:putative membrane protein insertion efficiency factor
MILRLVNKALARVLIVLVMFYQSVISPALHMLAGPGMGCRFQPTCSQYAIEALKLHGPFIGLWLAIKRILRCHPRGGYGYDPVPPPRQK